MDIGAIRLVLSHAAAAHGLPASIEQVDLGRIALKRLGLVGKSNQRDRRPTDDELAKLIAHFDGNPRQLNPMGRIIKFAVPPPCARRRSAGSPGATSTSAPRC